MTTVVAVVHWKTKRKGSSVHYVDELNMVSMENAIEEDQEVADEEKGSEENVTLGVSSMFVLIFFVVAIPFIASIVIYIFYLL